MARHCEIIILVSMIIINVLCKPDPTTQSPTITWRPGERSVDASGWNNRLISAIVDGKCAVDIKIIGRGVNDYLKETFPGDHEVKTAVTDSVLAGGDIKGETGWYTDTWASLVVVRKEGCTKNNYEPLSYQTKITSSPMDPEECNTIKQKMVALLIDHGYTMTPVLPEANPMFAIGSPPPIPPLGSPSSPKVIYRKANDQVNGQDWYDMRNVINSKDGCQQEMILQGRGVNDLFPGKCSAIEDIQLAIAGKVMAMKDEGNDMGWFTEEWGALYIVQQGKCFKRIYKDTNGQTKITTSPVDDGDCAAIQYKLFYYIKHYGGTSSRTDPPESKTTVWHKIREIYNYLTY